MKAVRAIRAHQQLPQKKNRCWSVRIYHVNNYCLIRCWMNFLFFLKVHERIGRKKSSSFFSKLKACPACSFECRYLLPASCTLCSVYLLLLQQDVDTGEIFSVVIRLDLALQTIQPLIQVCTALGKKLCLVCIKETLSLGLGGRFKLVPHLVETRQLLLHHGLSLWFLCNELHSLLQSKEQPNGTSSGALTAR